MRNQNVVIKPKKEFLEKLGIKHINIPEINFFSRKNLLRVTCEVKDFSHIKEINLLHKDLYSKFGNKLDIEFHTILINKNITETPLKELMVDIIERLKLSSATSRSFLSIYRIYINDKKIEIELNDNNSIELLKNLRIDFKLQDLIKEYGLSEYSVDFILGDFTREIKIVENKIKESFEEEGKNLEKAIEERKALNGNGNNNGNGNSSNNSNRNGNGNNKGYNGGNGSDRPKKYSNSREIKDKTISISDIYENDVCVLEGEVFYTDERELKNGKILKVFKITDNENSITTKIFLEKTDDIKVEIGDTIKVRGRIQIDTYNQNEKVMMINVLNNLGNKNVKKTDDSENKMVELHVHSKMSEMVGVASIADIIGRAKEYGHSHVAITDYSVIHSFPNAYSLAKKNNMNIIFGCEMYMVDDELPLVKNPKDIGLNEETFIVFDLETTGLNTHENEIIEIGAVKVKNKRIVDTFSALIKPIQDIPLKIQEITKITNSMVANKPSIDEVLPDFMKFIGDGTLVAHNAPFDMGFLHRDVKKYISTDFNPSVIDTLQMARDLYPTSKKFDLKSVSKLLGVSLENHHRAVDDSQATANIFINFLDRYSEAGVDNLSKITGTFKINTKNCPTKNIVLLVKNKTGLKNLYKLVSESHIETFGNKRARVLKSSVSKFREGLIVGSSLTAHFMNNGELIELYMRLDLESLEKNINFYDYIELLPKQAYSELIERENSGNISGDTYIENMNNYFYKLAKENNVKVIASSNVHYLDKSDSKIRSILLYGSGTVYRDTNFMTDNGFYFRNTKELIAEFDYLGADIAEEIVVKNTNAIANLTEMINPIPDGFYPPKMSNAEETVRDMTYNKAYKIYGNPLPELVSKRLERELKAIIDNGFSVLYLSAHKLVKKSLDNGYLVGSRGSVGSSLVAFMMDITEVNALYPHYICVNEECKHVEFFEHEGVGIDLEEKNCPQCGTLYKRDGYAIPFEVFMGFNGEKVPDIDLNFSSEYQNEIHRYCEELFGKENVFKAGTITTLAERNALGYVKKYVEDHSLDIGDAEISRLAMKCEGVKKTTGQHPGGMIVVPSDLEIYDFCPIQKPANDENSDSITTHYDYHVMDEQLVKLDLLGHDDPTTIRLLQKYTGIKIEDIPLSDPDTISIFSNTEILGIKSEDIHSEVGTFGVPEFGTPFVRQMLTETKPTTFAELVRISGLSHGTDVWLNNAQEFIKLGDAQLSEVVTVRDDIMNRLIDAGIDKLISFDIMEFVRKGKPTIDKEKWDSYSNIMLEHDIQKWYIESCRRIKYMFPKGHAVAYVMMAVRIAYFKVHYPLAFYAAYLSRKASDFDYEIFGTESLAKAKLDVLKAEKKLDVKKKTEQAISEIILEMSLRKISLLPIDIYKSDGFIFTIEGDKIRVPLIGLSGLGESVIENITKERKIADFLSIEDLKSRTKLSNTVIEKLKNLGSLGELSEKNQMSLF